MSAEEPKGPYIYQPFGMQDKHHWASGRIWGIGGVSILTKIDGLTKPEAETVLAALTKGESK